MRTETTIVDDPLGSGEILARMQQALLSHPMVVDCVVLLRSSAFYPAVQEPVAYVVASGPLSAERLNAHLQSGLPLRASLPTYVPLASLPLTAEGEIDAAALLQLEVIDADLVHRWEERLQSVAGIEEVAVVVQEEVPCIPPLHLTDVMPPLSNSAGWESSPFPQLPPSTMGEPPVPAELALFPSADAHGANHAHRLSLSAGPPLLLGDDAPQTLSKALLRVVALAPEKGGVYVQADGTEFTQSYPELLADAERILRGLRGLGLKPGDKVLFQLEHNQDFVSAFWGCTLGGFVPAPISIAPTYDQLNSTVSKLHNAWLLLDKPVILTGKDLESSVRSLSDLLQTEPLRVVTIEQLRASKPDPGWHVSQPDDMAILLLTSGSTGMPKGVVQTHRSLLARSASAIQHNCFGPENITLNVFPMDHVGGIVMTNIHGILLLDRQVHVPTQYIMGDVLRWMDVVERYRATLTWAPNFAFGLINAQAEEIARRKWDLSSMRFIINAGEAIVSRTARRFLEILQPHGLPATAMRPAWGMSETCSAVTFSERFTLEQTSDEDAFVEVGAPVPGFAMRVVDALGQLVEEGQSGRLEVKGPSVTTGYYNNPELNAEVFTADGWFNTGDLAMLQEGRLTITGRQKDVIIINGLNFYSHEIESVVEEVPGVEISFTAACAIRRPGSDTDELAIFFHTFEREPNALAELLKEVRARVVQSIGLNPRYLLPVEQADIPKTQIGKIQRTQLRARFEAGEFAPILKRVDILNSAANTLPDWFYRPLWRRKAAARPALEGVAPGRTLVFLDDLGLGEALCSTLTAEGSASDEAALLYSQAGECVRVEAGTDFCRLSASHYRIDPSNPSHYRLLMEVVLAEGGAVDRVVHLWTYAHYTDEPSTLDAVEQAQMGGTYSLLSLVKALAEVQGTDHPVRLLVASSHTQAVASEEVLACERTPLLGLVKAVSMEMPSLTCTHLDLSLEDGGSLSHLLAELPLTTDREVAYREGQRLVVRLERADLVDAEKTGPPFQAGGAYLLTGGLGGIGAEVARHLLSHYNARLLLIGRAPLSERLNVYQSLLTLGGEVRYETVDVCDLDALRSVIVEAEAAWGRGLDGILHLAGLYQAAPVVEETRESLAAILRPKVGGCWTALALLRERPGCIFVGFSSTTSFFDQAMFGAYAAGNRYLDGFCQTLRARYGIRSYCFGWSAWDETGMNRTQPGQEPIRATGRGFQTLAPVQGVHSLVAGMYAGQSHLLVGLDGSNPYIRRHCEFGGISSLRTQRLSAYYTGLASSVDRIPGASLTVEDRFGTESHCEAVRIAEMPRTATLEIDRERLAHLGRGRRTEAEERVAPRTDVERRLAAIWQEVLGVPQVGVQDNFFELGGHSLLATQVMSRIRDAFGINLPARELFKAPTLAGLALCIAAATGQEQGTTETPPLKPISREGILPLSFAQQRLWFIHQLDPESSAYNIPLALRLTGPLDAVALEQTFQEIVRRHEALRTTFTVLDTEPVQVIGASIGRLDLVDLSGLSPEVRERETQRRITEEMQRPFDLAQGPLCRSSLMKLGEEEHLLLFTVHHIVSDGWSSGVLLQELQTLYNAFCLGKPSPLLPLPIQYADYAVWQREWLQGEVLERQIAYWKAHLAGTPALLELPTDRPRPPMQTFRGAIKRRELSEELTRRLKALSRQEDATLFMTLLAAYQTLLSRYSGQEQVVVGTPIANRTHSEMEGLIGFFANTLALRGDLSGNPSFAEFLGRVRESALGAYAHQDLPLEKLVDELQPERSLSYSVLFQVAFVLQNSPRTDLEFTGLLSEPLASEGITAEYDLWLGITEGGNGLHVEVEYNTDLFDGERIERFLGHFQTLLEAVVADPHQRVSDLPLLTKAERCQLLETWNATETEYPRERCLHELIEAQVERTPDAIAVVWEKQTLTYAELNARANQVAHYLRSQGVGPEVLVGLCMERSLDMVVGLLGILKAGGAYVPLDPAYPLDRLAFMLADSQVSMLLSQTACLDNLPSFWVQVLCLDAEWELVAAQSEANPPREATVDNPAYVIYTSGSTGMPKGVLVPHSGLSNVIVAHRTALGILPGNRILQFASLSFDASVFEIVMALGSGSTLYVGTRETLMPGPDLVRFLRENAITAITVPPSALTALPFESLPALQTITVAGEECPADLVERWAPGRHFFNLYGPTETTIWATYSACVAGQARPTIGVPIPNAVAYVLDARQQPVPVGVPGELFIGGAGVVRGYLNRADLTAERFVPNPFSAEPGARMYRTGDLVRYLPQGNLEFLGQLDYQVKIRGYRIELGEIESALTEHRGIREAVVVAREDVPGDRRLVAYLVGSEGPVRVSELRERLQERLPEYMMPAIFVHLEALPLTPNGKINRKALPKPEAGTDAGREYVAPRTPTEEGLAAIWCEILHFERVGVYDNFFEVGGHSLLATQLISRIRSAFQVELPLRVLFETPTVTSLAMLIEAARGEASAAVPALARVSRKAPLPLSFAQQRLWFLDQFEPGSAVYNIPSAVRLIGALDVRALERSLQEIVRRHEALRTTFLLVEGAVSQAIHAFSPTPLEVIALDALSPEDRETEKQRWIDEEAQRPFDLSHGPLFRSLLLRLGDFEHILLLTMHHTVSDGWSQGVLMWELEALYTAFCVGKPSPLAELPLQYADYAVWQREWLQGETLERQLTYWKVHLSGAPALLELPTDRPRPAVQTFRGAVKRWELSQELTAGLKALSRQEDTTLFMTLLAVFQVLLARYSGQDDIVVGTAIANRTQAEVENLIGFFLNTLALRGDLSGNPSFVELLGRVREAALGAYAHQDLPFEKLVEELQPQRSMSHSPLFQVMFVIQNASADARELEHLRIEEIENDWKISKFDLSLFLAESGGRLRGALEYNTDLFEGDRMERLLGHFQTLLTAVVADPSQRISSLPLLTEPERNQLLVEWNATETPYPQGRCLHQLFEDQAERTPEAIALGFGAQHLTYEQLNARANQLAHFLRQQGVGPKVLVGLCVERSVEMVVGLLGILKAGGAYVPLDPASPVERLAFMLADCRAPILLTQQRLEKRLETLNARIVCLDDADLLDSWSSANPEATAHSDNMAYILYTSGSTGQPKGVMIPHRGLVNYLHWASQAYRVTEGAGTLVDTPVSFDLTVTSLLTPLVVGQKVILVPEADGVEALAAALKSRHDVTLVKTTPASLEVLRHLLPAEAAKVSRRLVIGGEALRWDTLSFWRSHSPETRLVNEYGPTETVVGCCVYEVSPQEPGTGNSVPIGRPIANTCLYLLDGELQPVPQGVPGELYIGGVGVTRGYLNRPELTGEKFVPDPFSGQPGARLYRTGDLCRYLSDGNLEYLGRIDHQVKIRGFRIELGEIESVLSQHPAIQEALVLAREDEPGDRRLVAYLVSSNGALNISALREHLHEKLPGYMVPSVFVTLDALPLSPNGKIDRKALPAPDRIRPQIESGYELPRSDTERALVQIWSEVLRLEQVGIHDNFFELGGNSILSIRIISRANQAGLRFTPRQVFQYQTIAELAAVAGTGALLQGEQGTIVGPVLLTPIQHWFFEQDRVDAHHYNQAFLLQVAAWAPSAHLRETVSALTAHHDALRLRYTRSGDGDGGWEQRNAEIETDRIFSTVDLSAVSESERRDEITAECARLQASLDLENGPLLRAAYFDLGAGQPGRLLLAIHHLAVDGVSWRVLLEDLQTGLAQLGRGAPVVLPPKTTSFQRCSERLAEYARSAELGREQEYWGALGQQRVTDLPVDHRGGSNTVASERTVQVSLDVDETRALLSEVPAVYHTQINDVLLTALAQAFQSWTGSRSLLVDLEGHGREALFEDVDLSRTVGWFTSLYPVLLTLPPVAGDVGEALKTIKETIRGIPQHGVGYGVLRYLSQSAEISRSMADLPAAQISFNYHGYFDIGLDAGPDGAALVSATAEMAGPMHSPRSARTYLLDVIGQVTQERLQITWFFSEQVYDRSTIEGLAASYLAALRELIAHCRSPRAGGYTPSDFPRANIDQEDLEQLFAELGKS